ncbi:hypothetical protein OHA71_20500 [Streptomyces sp. NBC_00444]|uniref:hypothetical protein n=1 Tax=Streptomyces sp. NBC_00444 TaxID=2975744 RepID=UPI002E1F729E
MPDILAEDVDDAPAATVLRERRRSGSALWWPLVALVSAAAVAYAVLNRRLTGDLQYTLGALRTGGEAGYSPSEVFTHRPYFYRWFIAGLDSWTFGTTTAREALIAAAGVLLAAAAAYALYAALLRRVTGREAALTAGATGLALALAPRNDFLQAEWAAVVLTVVAVAAAIGPERTWRAVLLAAVPLALAVLMKYSTATTAVIGVLLVYAVDRGRAVRLALVSVPVAVGLFGVSLLAGSHEWQWVGDMPATNQSTLGRTGIHPLFILERSVDYLADRAVPSPVLLLVPGALLLVLTRVRGRRRRIELSLVALTVGLCAQAAVVVQGNWFLYHGAPMPVLAAAVWGLAVGGARRSPPWCFGAVSLLYGALPVLYTAAPRGFQRPYVLWALGLLALLAALVDAVRERREAGSRRRSAALVALAGAVCLAGCVWPGSPHLVRQGKVTVTSAEYLREGRLTEQEADRLRSGMPADAPVLYLAFGNTAYYVGHPVQCRYPAATFLQRTRLIPDITEATSYKENADCVDHDPAPYAVLDPRWFRLAQVAPDLRRRIAATYDCPPASGESRLVLCRRR